MFGFVGCEVGWGQIQFQQVLAAGQVQRSRRGTGAFALFEDVGDVFAAISLESQRVLEGSIDFLRAVDFAQGEDFLDVVQGG